MQPTEIQATDPVATPTTVGSVAPSRAAIERLTPASVLRAAAGYLHQYGWWQDDLFDNPQSPTPCACPLGAIRMAVIGTPEICAEHLRTDVLSAFNAAVAALADHLIHALGVWPLMMPWTGQVDVLFPSDLEQVVIRWNDHPARNIGQVIAALNSAADEWDRIHTTPDHNHDSIECGCELVPADAVGVTATGFPPVASGGGS